MSKAEFYNAIRYVMPKGRLTVSQVEGFEALLKVGSHLPRSHMAYVLATAYHETGARMVPVREGFAKTDRGARNAVARLYARGRISRNYAVEHKKTGQSYYGRGYVQLTHYDNYRKTGEALGIDLVNDPDLMLVPVISADAIIWGMEHGSYRGKSLSTTLPSRVDPTAAQWRSARRVINGDMKKNGTLIGGYAQKFYKALEKLS